MKTTTQRALILTRVSTEGQKDGISLTEQEQVCRGYCADHGLAAVELPPDIPRAISGSLPWEKRVDLQAALDLYKSGAIDKIVVYAQNRLERNNEVLIKFIDAALRVHGRYDVVSALSGQPIKYTGMGGFESKFNETWRDVILETTYRKRYALIKGGHAGMGGTPPLGLRRIYALVGGKRTVKGIEIVPAEAKVVRIIFRLYQEGLGVQAITTRLNNDRVPVPSAMKGRKAKARPFHGVWHAGSVSNILTDTAYVGRWQLFSRDRAHKLVVLEIEREAITFKVPPIIDDDDFEMVQRGLQQRRARWDQRAAGRRVEVWPLQALIHCSCGQMFHKRPTRAGTPYLACTARRRRLPCANYEHYRVRHDVLLEAVTKGLKNLFSDPAQHVRRYLADLDDRVRSLELDLRPVVGDLGKLEARRSRLLQLMKNDILTDTEFDAEMADLAAATRKLEKGTKPKRDELARLEALKGERSSTLKALGSASFKVEWGLADSNNPETALDGAFVLLQDVDGKVLDARKVRDIIVQGGLHLVLDESGCLTINGMLASAMPPPKRAEARGTMTDGGVATAMALVLEQQYIDEMIAHAKEDAPNECCGIIAGAGGRAKKLYRAINAEASPYRYSVDPKDLLRIHREVDGNDWEFLVIYHSHMHTEAYPSPTDVRLAAWPEAYYVLVSLMDEAKPVVRAYRITDGAVAEEPVEVA